MAKREEGAIVYELGSPELLASGQKSRFKSVPGFGLKQKGQILLPYHNDPASFKNIKIRNVSHDY